MDSITQAALGAAVGEAVLGRRVGRRAAAWGAFFGTLPDLDVLVGPFVSDVQALLAHRGPTHALLFSVVTAPAFGFLLSRVHHRFQLGPRPWFWLAFWTLFTHPLLDALTGYGTQLFWPLSSYPVALSTISIVDPLFTLPLLAGLLTALILRGKRRPRFVANALGLGLSTFYLGITMAGKAHVGRILERSLVESGLQAQATFTTPTLFNNVLWTCLVDDGDRVWVGLYSYFDRERIVRLRPVDKGPVRLSDLGDGEAGRVLRWFTRGFYRTRLVDGRVQVDDFHVGTADMWLNGGEGVPIFRFTVVEDSLSGEPSGFITSQPGMSDRTFGDTMDRLRRRAGGSTGSGF